PARARRLPAARPFRIAARRVDCVRAVPPQARPGVSEARERAGGWTMIRVVVIDDSASTRHTLPAILEGAPELPVVARGGDGDGGLRQILAHSPDAVTLDLDMPRMDGFTLLRILMARRPTPVLVISSHAGRDNVFRALELGAIDFIAKPASGGAAE